MNFLIPYTCIFMKWDGLCLVWRFSCQKWSAVIILSIGSAIHSCFKFPSQEVEIINLTQFIIVQYKCISNVNIFRLLHFNIFLKVIIMADSPDDNLLEKYLGILQLTNESKIKVDKSVKDKFRSNLTCLIDERKFMTDKMLFKTKSYKYLIEWYTCR